MDYRKPEWVRHVEKHPFTYNRIDKFMNFNLYPRNYRDGSFKQSGYNPNHNSTRTEYVNLYREDIVLKPY